MLSLKHALSLPILIFLILLTTLSTSFFPETVKKFNCNIHRIEPWMTVGILTSRRKKGTLYKAQLKNPTVTYHDNFRAFRNLYNVVVRTAKKTFLHSQIENNAKNLRKTWQILSNSICKPKNNKKKLCFSYC